MLVSAPSYTSRYTTKGEVDSRFSKLPKLSVLVQEREREGGERRVEAISL